MNIDVNLDDLIFNIKKQSILWDKTLRNDKDRRQMKKAWNSICFAINKDFGNLSRAQQNEYEKIIITKWYNMRDNWVRSNKKEKKQNQLISKDMKRMPRKYIYYDKLIFLKKNYENPHMKDEMNERASSSSDRIESPQASMSEPMHNDSVPQRKHSFDEEGSINTFSNELLKSFENSAETFREEHNSHMAFFISLLPSLSKLKEDEILQFRISVLESIKNLRNSSRCVHNTNTSKTENGSLIEDFSIDESQFKKELSDEQE